MPHKICDFDTRQGTSAAWLPRCLEERFEPANSVNAFKAAGPALAQKVHYDLLIIHAPARASDGIQRVAERSSFVVQPTTPALENLAAVKRLFDELIKIGIPKVRIVFVLNHVLTVVEEQAAREFLREAGYEVLSGFLPAKTSYRDAQDHSLSVTQIRHEELNAKAFPAIVPDTRNLPPCDVVSARRVGPVRKKPRPLAADSVCRLGLAGCPHTEPGAGMCRASTALTAGARHL